MGCPVAAMARNARKAEHNVPTGIQIRIADYDDTSSLERGFEGVEKGQDSDVELGLGERAIAARVQGDVTGRDSRRSDLFRQMRHRPFDYEGRHGGGSGHGSSPQNGHGYFFSISSRNAADNRAKSSASSRISSPTLNFRIAVSGL
jgi:hypothetical protein